MREGFLRQVRLVCPRCRSGGESGVVEHPLEPEAVFRRQDGFWLEGFLACTNEHCRCRYPLIAGVPVVLKDLAGWWRAQRGEMPFSGDCASEIREFLEGISREGSFPDTRSGLLGAYLDSHYGGAPDAPAPVRSLADPERFWERLARLSDPGEGKRYPLALDLGCSVGRYAFDLARVSDLAVGMDMDFHAVSRAAGFQREGKVVYRRRRHGRFWEVVDSPYRPSENALFLVADALDPPFGAESFDLVAAVNLLDSLRLPLILLGQADALLRPGGRLILSSPYEWREEICDPGQWLEAADMDSPAVIRGILEGRLMPETGIHYRVAEEHMDVPWVLRNHRHSWALFMDHVLLATKRDAGGEV